MTIAAGGTLEGTAFPADTAATTTSSFGNASSGTNTLGGNPNSGTIIYNGNTAATPKTITMDARNTGADTINVTTAGQTLTLTNLLYTQGTSQYSNVNWNFGGAGNLTIAGNIANSGSATYTIGITKNDAGTLTLSGTNKYSGNTMVNGGTLP